MDAAQSGCDGWDLEREALPDIGRAVGRVCALHAETGVPLSLPAAEQLPGGRAGSARVLDGISRRFATRDGFGAGVGCEQELGHEFGWVVARHAEEVDYSCVQVVVDLNF